MMDLATIVVTPEEAAAKLAEYERALVDERGLPVIRLSEAIDAGGTFPDGLPRLAVVRADAERCRVTVRYRNTETRDLVFGDGQGRGARNALVGTHHVRVTTLTPPSAGVRQSWGGSTVVPLVPPKCRPRRPRLGSCHVLWEVEAWDPTPPVDPALIRHIRGDLWAVLATWELTDLERAVLAQRGATS